MIKRYFYAVAASIMAVLILAGGNAAQTSPSKKDFPNIKIKNFGKMDERFYRGGQPKEGQYVSLKHLGVNTVLDLREDPKDYAKAEAEAAGLRYINIPMSDKDYPPQSTIVHLTNTLNDPSVGVFFAHCAGGRHRTGILGAIYRFRNYGWSYDQVYDEMKNYDFYTRWGHGEMKEFVKDYAYRTQVWNSIGAAASNGSLK